MSNYKVLICGAGRIGAGWMWSDKPYTHAGAVKANGDRAELCGFVEPDRMRASEARLVWGVPVYAEPIGAIHEVKPDIVCIATQPEQQEAILNECEGIVKAVYCEKPYMGGKYSFPVQVNYIRRADPYHRILSRATRGYPNDLYVCAKDDIHTRCHFEDLAKWWEAHLEYIPFNGPNAYVLFSGNSHYPFRDGGVNGGECMAAMFRNLLDHLDGKADLFSPAY